MDVLIPLLGPSGGRPGVNENHIRIVREALPEARIFFTQGTKEAMSKGIDPTILITRATIGDHDIQVDYCMNLKNLRWIHALSAGVEAITSTAIATIPGLILSNSRGIHGIPMSEHVLGFIINHYRGLARNRINQAAHVWERYVPEEIYGKTLCILGMGSIAADVAKRAKAFGMTVLGVKRTVTAIENVDEVFPSDRMDEAIARADTVLMLLPATNDTKKIMDANKFGTMKDGAFFINVSRASTTDTEAMIAALKSGKLAGAALDVYDTEPLPADHPLWDIENVEISPHVSAQSPHYMQRAFELFRDIVPYFLRGERLPTQVDIDKY